MYHVDRLPSSLDNTNPLVIYKLGVLDIAL